MILSSHVKMTESIREREEKVREAVEKKAVCHFLYCITLPSNEQNLLDIHPYRELRKRNEYGEPFVIIGLTRSRQEAVQMVADMAAHVADAMERPEDFKADFIKYRDSFWEDENESGKE
jgi:hypothetical protein